MQQCSRTPTPTATAQRVAPEPDALDAGVDAVVDFVAGLGRAIASLFGAFGDVVLSLVSEPVLDGLAATQSTHERTLTPRERALAKQVFGDSIDLDRVRVGEGGALLFSLNGGREITLGNEIVTHEGRIREETLVHELAHVWQYQHGGADYAPKALVAQGLESLGIGDGYDWRSAVDAGERWKDLNPEQQAELLADAYQDLYTSESNRDRLERYRDVYYRALKEVRAGRGAP
ncbi:MAG: hypothetical protein AB7S68_01860 [Polyangiaceae bacterium]